MPELLAKRTANSKTYDLGNGRFALDASIGQVHYKDAQGAWQNINTQISAGAMTAAPYSFRLLQNTFNQGQVVEFSVGADYVRLQPMALEWTNDLNQISQVATPQAVTGTVTNTPVQLLPDVQSQRGSIKWLNAYGAGRDFEWSLEPTRMTKVLTIPSLANLPAPPAFITAGGNPALRLNMIFADSNMDVYVDGTLWTKQANSQVQTFGRVEFRRNGVTLWDFAPLLYWDSEGNQGESIKTLRRAGNNLFIEIRVPYSWLQTAVYPVSIDTTIDVQVDASTNDGYEFPSVGNVDVTGNYLPIYSAVAASSRRWVGYRFVTTLNTGITISSAYVRAYIQNATDDANFNQHVEKVASPAAFVAGSGNYNITGRTITTASVSVIQDDIGAGWYSFPSIIAPLQEASDANTMDAVVVVWKPNTDATKQMAIRSWDYPGNAYDAQLHIEYSEAGGLFVPYYYLNSNKGGF